MISVRLTARCVSFNKAGRGVAVERITTSQDVICMMYSNSSFFCPRCCRSRRPSLSQVLTLLVDLKALDLQLPEGMALQSLTNRAIHWLERVRSALAKDELAAYTTKQEPGSHSLHQSTSENCEKKGQQDVK